MINITKLTQEMVEVTSVAMGHVLQLGFLQRVLKHFLK